MAKLVTKDCSDNKIEVKIEIEENLEKFGYAPTLKMNLSTKKLQALGWTQNNSLKDMYRKLIATMKENIDE